MWTDKQKDFINNANKTYNGKIGATRSGKTFLDFMYRIPAKTRELSGKDGLYMIMGVTTATIERNVLSDMRNVWGDDKVGKIKGNLGNASVQLFGETFHVVGHEKISAVARLQGTSIKYCYIDEIVRMNKETFEMLHSRLDHPYSTVDFTGNPDNPTHFVNKFLTDPDNQDEIYLQTYTLDDNEHLDPKVAERIKNMYRGTVNYDRYILGRWTVAEGSIYPMFDNDNILTIEEWQQLLDEDKIGQIQVGVDIGGNKSKTSFQATATTKDVKTIITIKERRFDVEEDIDKINNEFKKFIESLRDEVPHVPIRAVFVDNAEQVIIRSMRAFARRDGYISERSILDARKTEILERIRTYQALINLNRYKVLENCTITQDAFRNAVWSDKTDKNGKEIRLDDGTTNIDTLDAQEYSTENMHKQLIRR